MCDFSPSLLTYAYIVQLGIARFSLIRMFCSVDSISEIHKSVSRLAHWDGLQPYSDEDTSRGSLVSSLLCTSTVPIPTDIQLLALLTCGEGSHNFVSFFALTTFHFLISSS